MFDRYDNEILCQMLNNSEAKMIAIMEKLGMATRNIAARDGMEAVAGTVRREDVASNDRKHDWEKDIILLAILVSSVLVLTYIFGMAIESRRKSCKLQREKKEGKVIEERGTAETIV